jgi:hypothetical protein
MYERGNGRNVRRAEIRQHLDREYRQPRMLHCRVENCAHIRNRRSNIRFKAEFYGAKVVLLSASRLISTET